MTTRTDGIPETIEEAWAAAKLEDLNGQAGPADAGPGAAPADPPLPPPESPDQPSGADPELQSLVDSLVEQPQPETQMLSAEDPAFWAQTTEVNGESVTLAQMRDGFMKGADYTQKTQALAEQRLGLEDASKLYDAYVSDPSEFARALAVEYGWLEEDQTAPVVDVPIPQVFDEEAMETRLSEGVEQRLASDPRIQEAEVLRAQQAIAAEFDRIESALRVSIPLELRNSLIEEAQRRQIFDFEILLKARLASKAERTPDNLERSGSIRPRSAGGLGSVPEPVANPTTVEEAWQQAKVEAGL